jgi:hypothetical protein
MSVKKSTAIFIGCFVLALVFLAPPFIQGDEWNLATKFTVNRPFEVPKMVLQANTPYVIRLFDSPSTRTVVQIFNEDQTELLTMFMAVASERPEPADETVFTFIETAPTYPLPMKEWFYPGRVRGLEFVYPKDQAMKIASHALEPILAADAGDLHDLATIEVESIGPVRDQVTVTESAANITEPESREIVNELPAVEEKPAVEEFPAEDAEPIVEEQIAQDSPRTDVIESESEVQQEEPSEAPAIEEAQELPATAGELPLMALIGVLFLGAGLGLKVLSTKS